MLCLLTNYCYCLVDSKLKLISTPINICINLKLALVKPYINQTGP